MILLYNISLLEGLLESYEFYVYLFKKASIKKKEPCITLIGVIFQSTKKVYCILFKMLTSGILGLAGTF